MLVKKKQVIKRKKNFTGNKSLCLLKYSKQKFINLVLSYYISILKMFEYIQKNLIQNSLVLNINNIIKIYVNNYDSNTTKHNKLIFTIKSNYKNIVNQFHLILINDKIKMFMKIFTAIVRVIFIIKLFSCIFF